ncbi:MAG: extracellular solute-binding protein [Beijerinckiaceae bacterium]
MNHTTLAGLAMAAALSVTFPALAQSKDVNVYTTREKRLLAPMLDAFTKETGIQVNAIFIEKGLEERVKAEGAASPADIIVLVDAARMILAAKDGLFQPISSATVEKTVPANLRDAKHGWTALTLRSRIIYASKERVKEESLAYEDLADPKWKGKICIRSGQHGYNIGLFAALIAHHGEAKGSEIIKGIKANLAKKPSGGDRDVAKDIAAGVCDVGLANTYYLGLMAAHPEQKVWAAAVKPLASTFRGGGTHVNVSAAGIAKHAPNRDNAVKLLEFMVSPAAQTLYADVNHEYPVSASVAANETKKQFGAINPDRLSLQALADNAKKASELVDRLGFDN